MAVGPAMIEAQGQAETNTQNLGFQEQMRQDAMHATSPANIYRLGSWLMPGLLSDPDQLQAPPATLLAQAAQSTRPGADPTKPTGFTSGPAGPEEPEELTRREERWGDRQRGAGRESMGTQGQGDPQRGRTPDRQTVGGGDPAGTTQSRTRSRGGRAPGRAEGGPVEAGKPYTVGEQGPEVITPKQDGTVIPNPQTGADMMQDKQATYDMNLAGGPGDGTGQSQGGPGFGEWMEAFIRNKGALKGEGEMASAGDVYSQGQTTGNAGNEQPGIVKPPMSTPSSFAAPGRKHGGKVKGGQDYTVGEEGEEVVQPDAQAPADDFQLQRAPAQKGTSESFSDIFSAPIEAVTGADKDAPSNQPSPKQLSRQASKRDLQDVEEVGLSNNPEELFRNPGEAFTGHLMNLALNPGQLNPAAYERAQADANQALNASTLGVQGALTGRGWDPNSPMGQMLIQAGVNTAQTARNKALQDFTMMEEDLYRQDLGQFFNTYMGGLSTLLGMGGAQSNSAMLSGFSPASNPNAGATEAGQNAAATGVAAYAAFASSANWKEDVKTIENALGKVLKMRGVEYFWKGDLPEFIKDHEGKPDIGLIAEEVAEVASEASLEADGKIWGINYLHIVGLLVEAIKDQQGQIDKLKEKVDGTTT